MGSRERVKMGGDWVFILLFVGVTANILPNQHRDELDIDLEDEEVIEMDEFEIFGGFGYSRSLADIGVPVVYKDLTDMAVKQARQPKAVENVIQEKFEEDNVDNKIRIMNENESKEVIKELGDMLNIDSHESINAKVDKEAKDTEAKVNENDDVETYNKSFLELNDTKDMLNTRKDNVDKKATVMYEDENTSLVSKGSKKGTVDLLNIDLHKNMNKEDETNAKEITDMKDIRTENVETSAPSFLQLSNAEDQIVDDSVDAGSITSVLANKTEENIDKQDHPNNGIGLQFDETVTSEDQLEPTAPVPDIIEKDEEVKETKTEQTQIETPNQDQDQDL